MTFNSLEEKEQAYHKLDKYRQILYDNIIDPHPKRKLLDFVTTIDEKYYPERFSALITDEVQQLIDSDNNEKLIITAPPRVGKSRIISEMLPAFHLGYKPDKKIVMVSYNATSAESKSYKAREIVESSDYAKIFPNIRVAQNARSVEHWITEDKNSGKSRGYYHATGIGGLLTGFDMDLGLIDDPVKDEAEGASNTIQDKIWGWYSSVFHSRVMPSTKIIIIMTRWHEYDLVGRIMNSKGSNQFKVIRLPAISETQEQRDQAHSKYNLPSGLPDPLGREYNKALCPIRLPLEFLEREFKYGQTSTLHWNALYQGNPSPLEGNKIKRQTLETARVAHIPIDDSKKHLKRVRFWDKASSKEKRSDFTVGLLMCLDLTDNKFYVEDIVRGKWATEQRNNIILQTAEKDFKRYGYNLEIVHEQEPGSSGKDVALIINQMLSAYSVRAVKATGSKEHRLDPFVSAVNNNLVYFYEQVNKDGYGIPKELLAVYFDELCVFPNGEHDDIVDASSGAFNALNLHKRKKIKVMF